MDTVMKTIHLDEPAAKNTKKTGAPLLISALAFICLSWGILSPILGLVFFIIHSTVAEDRAFGDIGTGLMIVSIPLLLAGSHFLDVWDKHRKGTESGGKQ
jgi:hypothetical protein